MEAQGTQNLTYRERFLKQAFEKYKIEIDTCSLLYPACEKLLQHMERWIRESGNPLLIPTSVYEELYKHATTPNPEKPELAENAKRKLILINQMREKGLVEFRGQKSDGTFNDRAVLSHLIALNGKYNMMLITQDKGLARDVLKLNMLDSVKGRPIAVRRIDDAGYLALFDSEKLQPTGTDAAKPAKPVRTAGTRSAVSDSEKTAAASLPVQTGAEEKPAVKPVPKQIPVKNRQPFAESHTVTRVPEDIIPLSHVPAAGDTVKTEHGTVTLGKEISRGGEGIIYRTNTSYVAKIYLKDKLDQRKKAKLERMVTREVNYPGVCYPVDLLYNQENEFVGYLMPEAKGEVLFKTVFLPKLLAQKHPDWKKADLVQLAITILKMFQFLHERNIIIGDINPYNILVVSPKEIYLVDTDSFQIEEFPCPVGFGTFTAPEIQQTHFNDYLRTMDQENFAIATLLFMIMLPGKHPYSMQGGSDPVQNIREMDFSYPFGEQSNKKTPAGPWRYMWSHLTYQMKNDFYNTFQKNGEYARPESRLSAIAWLNRFNTYYKLLESGQLTVQDPMSNDIFPTRFKKNPNAVYGRCSICHQETEEYNLKDGVCFQCRQDVITYPCPECGGTIEFPLYKEKLHLQQRYRVCKACHEKRMSAGTGYTARSNPPRYSTAPTAVRSAAVPARQPMVPPRTQTSGTAASAGKKTKRRRRSATFTLTCIVAAVELAALFIFRMDLMELAFHNSEKLRSGGFVFNVIWPMVWLVIPWMLSLPLIFGILSLFGAVLRGIGKFIVRHKVLSGILAFLLIAALGVWVYERFNPGFAAAVWQSITELAG